TQLVAAGWNNTILTSPDGISWTRRANPLGNWSFKGLTWNGKQLMGVGAWGYFMSSPDGINWSYVKAPTDEEMLTVAWADTQWVAVGPGDNVWTSPDGITWSSGKSGYDNQLEAILWTGKRTLIAGAYGAILSSPYDPPVATRASSASHEDWQWRITPAGFAFTPPLPATGQPLKAAVLALNGKPVLQLSMEHWSGGEIPVDTGKLPRG